MTAEASSFRERQPGIDNLDSQLEIGEIPDVPNRHGHDSRLPNETSINFKSDDDYIALDFSEDLEDVSFTSYKGKERETEREYMNTANKRTMEEIKYNDEGYRSKKQKLNTMSRLTPWLDQVDWSRCRNLAEMLHNEVQAFVNFISPTYEEHEVRGMIITSITRAIQDAWPDARVFPFGSYETKLYLPSGDIDLVVQTRAMEHQDKRRILYSLAHILRKANITGNVQVIAKAKVPIIKFVTSHGRLCVDISLNQTNGLRAGSMINRLLTQIPAVQPLVLTTKMFLNQRSMNEVYSGGLGSYALVCMVVSFLQMHPKIRAGEINPMQNLGVLLMEFFELYGHHFNYERTGISVRDGGTYFDKVTRDWDDPRNPALLSIEDPVDISRLFEDLVTLLSEPLIANDVSKNSYNMPRVRKTLAGAHEVLTATAFMHCRVLTSKSRGDYVDLRQGRHTQKESILSCVMSVSQEILNHRRMVKQLYDRGVLQRLLGISLDRKKDMPISRPVSQNEASKAVERAWRNNSDMEESEGEGAGDRKASSDAEEKSLYSLRSPRKRRRIRSPGFLLTKKDPVYIAESDDDESDNDPSLDDSSTLDQRSSSLPTTKTSKLDVQARRAYWASKGLAGGPEVENE